MTMEFMINNVPVSRSHFRARLTSHLFDCGRECIRDTFRSLRQGRVEEFSSVQRNDEAGDTCFVEEFRVKV